MSSRDSGAPSRVRYGSLCAYYLVYFIVNGVSTFLPKYYAELGMADGQIGVLMSVPSLVALAFLPLMGALSDRVAKKRYLLAAALALMACVAFVAPGCRGFWPQLAVASLFVTFSTSASPIATAISLEYCAANRRSYGPIRFLGTVGYQAGVLLVAALLAHSLHNLFPLMGAAVLVACGITFLMPDIVGHQHSRAKVPVRALFRDRHVCWLLAVVLFSGVTSQFYMSFFSKYMGDLGMDNATVSWIALLSVLPELPFLAFSDRIGRKTNIWNWLLLGLVINGVRWLGLAAFTTVAPIIAFQLLGFSVMFCFELMPAYYLARRVPAELYGSAQSVLSFTTFGLGKVVGSLLGGVICERTGIPAVFAFNGAMLLAGCALLWRPTRRLIREEATMP